MTPHLQRFLSPLEGVRKTPSGFEACCPCAAHGNDGKGDENPSLSISLGEEFQILIHCFGGCTTDLVLESLGLEYSDLWPGPADPDGAGGEIRLATEDPVTRNVKVIQVSGLEDPELLDQVYGSLLGKLPLNDSHRQKLRGRGLDNGQIDRLGYRSLSFFATRQKGLVPLRTEFGDDLLRVPGFVRKRGVISVVDLPGGIVIPVRGVAGRIVALKIRCDDDKQGSKYLWFSGGGGPSCGSPAHVPLGVTASGLVRVTEGPIKADIAFLKSGLPTIAVAGVSCWAPAIPLLKDLGAEAVRLAFDADVLVKQSVAHQLRAFSEALATQGFQVQLERWSPEAGNGIDDVLAGGGSIEVLEGADATAAIQALACDEPGVAEGPPGGESVEMTPGQPDIIPMPAPQEAGPIQEVFAADPEPMPAPCPGVFPLEVLPAPVAAFARDLAASIGCPVDYVAFSQFVVAAAAIGDSRTLYLGGSWFESARIYGGIIGHPGDGKTPAQGAAVRPVYRLQQLHDLDYEQAMLRYEEQQAEYEAAAKASKARSRSRGKDHEQDDPDDEAGAAPEKPVKPRPVRFITVDATVEALAPILKENPRGLLKHHDELSGWVRAMNMYRGGKGGDRQFYLSAWSGQDVVVDRKSEGTRSIYIPHPFLCILGSIQPDMLTELADARGRQDGFIDRILFVYPDTSAGQPWPDQPVPREVIGSWARVLRRLYYMKMKEKDDGTRCPKVLRPTPEAVEIFKAWWAIHLAEMRGRTFDRELLGGPFNKFRAHLARLALVIHCLRRVCDETDSPDIEAGSARRAATLADYFKAQCIKVHGRLRVPVEDRQAEAVFGWICRNGGRCTARDLCHNEVAGIRKSTEARRMLKDLEDRGLGHCTTNYAGKKESLAFAVGEVVG
jgi:hypothetical protein